MDDICKNEINRTVCVSHEKHTHTVLLILFLHFASDHSYIYYISIVVHARIRRVRWPSGSVVLHYIIISFCFIVVASYCSIVMIYCS